MSVGTGFFFLKIPTNIRTMPVKKMVGNNKNIIATAAKPSFSNVPTIIATVHETIGAKIIMVVIPQRIILNLKVFPLQMYKTKGVKLAMIKPHIKNICVITDI